MLAELVLGAQQRPTTATIASSLTTVELYVCEMQSAAAEYGAEIEVAHQSPLLTIITSATECHYYCQAPASAFLD